jgi:glutamate-1-semialdehyde 2,1-aminomutase
MKTIDYRPLVAELAQEYAQRSPRSAAVHEQALKYLVDGGSHALRLHEPFPPRIVMAKGAWITDEDGHAILDLWQGHLGNLLGHNPEVVTQVLARGFEEGFGLHTGFADRLQAETAEILCRQTGAERVRFTTSGSLATMYAIMLARAFTGRELVVKLGGGWHGAQPWALKGVGYKAGADGGFQHVDSDGLPTAITDDVVVTGFNDPGLLQDHFDRLGDRVACLIIEPVIGAGGVIPASAEFLETARHLTGQHGALLILDEVISGFRFRAGDAGALYGIQPDLATFGKIIGGGMPVAAVTGRADVLGLVGRAAGQRVKFSGGTYCAHPASLLAAKTLMTYLVENEATVYPQLAAVGAKARETMVQAFSAEGVYARCTGDGAVLGGSSLAMLHFPYREDILLDRPDSVYNPELCDVALSHQVLMLALLLEDVHLINGHGAFSTAHTDADVERLGQACQKVARRVREHR